MFYQKTAVIKIAETPTPFHVAKNTIIHTKYALSTVECYVLVSEYQTGSSTKEDTLLYLGEKPAEVFEKIF